MDELLHKRMKEQTKGAQMIEQVDILLVRNLNSLFLTVKF